MLRELFGAVGEVVEGATRIAVAPIAVVLGVSKVLVERAVKAGCKTEKEIQEWISKHT